MLLRIESTGKCTKQMTPLWMFDSKMPAINHGQLFTKICKMLAENVMWDVL
jgi:hypothetical protein